MKLLKNLFKVRTDLEKLEDQRKDLLNKAFLASKNNRTLSDSFTLQASKIEDKIIQLKIKK